MKPQIPWLRVFVEGVVIGGSILLAFGIDAAWTERQERAEEDEILEGLRADFVENASQVDFQLGLREDLISGAQSLLDQLKTGPLGSELTVADSVLSGLLASPTFDPITSTLDAAVSSGRIGLVRSRAVRRHLADWDRVTVGLHENELAVRNVIHSFLAAELAAQTRLGSAANRGARAGAGELTEPSGSRPLRTTSELEGAVGLYLRNSALVRRDLLRTREIQDSILASIEAGTSL